MNRFQIITIFILAATLLGSCAKPSTEGVNEAEQRYFEAWLSKYAPDAVRTGRGIYVLPEYTVEGEGEAIEEDGFAILRYKLTNLEGDVIEYTNEETARQLGEYVPSGYYGAKVTTTAAETIRAGEYDGIYGMKVGGKKKFIVPSWLMSYKNYETEEDYLANVSDYVSTIYEVEVVDFTTNINDWQLEKIIECINKPDFYDGAFVGTEVKDTTSKGFYFKMLNKVPSEKEFPKDTTFYINYTGRLISDPDFGNGIVFDTSVEKVALDNYLSTSATYKPQQIKWGETHSEITMGGNSVISGFSQTLWQMVNCGPGTKAVGVFYSPLGYSYNGSGTIPPYAPLIFEIEIVENEE